MKTLKPFTKFEAYTVYHYFFDRAFDSVDRAETLKDLSKLLGMSKDTLRQKISKDKCIKTRSQGCRRFKGTVTSTYEIIASKQAKIIKTLNIPLKNFLKKRGV